MDRGENGIVKYGIVSPSDNTFRIGREDGVITIGRDIDREIPSDKFVQVGHNLCLYALNSERERREERREKREERREERGERRERERERERIVI